MKVGFVFLVLALTAKAAVIEKAPPSMTWKECEGHQHCLEIDFHDGKPTDLALLDPIHKENDCVLGGHFRDEGTNIVVTAKCPFDSSKAFEVSFSSPRNPEMTFFKVQDGKTSLLNPGLDKGSIDSTRSNPKCLENPKSLNGTVPPMPKNGFTVDMRIYYDDSLYARFGGQTKSRIQAAVAHANNVLSFPSLQYPIRLDVRHIDYLQGLTWSAEQQHIDFLGYYHTSTGERLFSFWADHLGGNNGLALIGVVCGVPQYRISIITYYATDIGAGLTFAHETGHNLGMCHDFNNGVDVPRYCTANGASCTGINGVMDYGSERTQWSCCSNEDFYDYYAAHSTNWCLPGV